MDFHKKEVRLLSSQPYLITLVVNGLLEAQPQQAPMEYFVIIIMTSDDEKFHY